MNALHIGQTTHVTVQAKNPWNDSRIDLASGCTYDFIVPENEHWSDSSIHCGADGYPPKWYLAVWERFRRAPTVDWFKLIGTVGHSAKNPIIIGSRLTDFSPIESGRLYCFANDVRIMYWNNSGAIRLNITRKA
jgi:hypothetical protein